MMELKSPKKIIIIIIELVKQIPVYKAGARPNDTPSPNADWRVFHTNNP